MAQLRFLVRNQTIKRKDKFKVVAKSKNYLYAKFEFSGDWTGEITAQFRNERDGDDPPYEKILDENGECEVPWETLQYDNSKIYVTAFCGDLITANAEVVYVNESGYSAEGESSKDPTPSVYEQILEKLDEIDHKVTDKDVIAESWAIGGTGKREDEDTDNAKYYATQAGSSAGIAAGSAASAASNAGIAAQAAGTAATKAGEAAGSATAAAGSAATASSKASEAAGSATAAAGSATTAAEKAEAATSSAGDAAASAAAANTAAGAASGSASAASGSAAAAAGSAETSEANARAAVEAKETAEHIKEELNSTRIEPLVNATLTTIAI